MGERPQRYIKAAIVTAIAIMVIIMLTGFKASNEQANIVKLFEQRAMILQDAYYGKIPKGEAKYRLLEIETGTLLQDDLSSLLLNTDGEMDIINDVYIIKCIKIGNEDNQRQYKIEVLWDMQGITGHYYQKIIYFISVTTAKGKEKLCVMDVDSEI